MLRTLLKIRRRVCFTILLLTSLVPSVARAVRPTVTGQVVDQPFGNTMMFTLTVSATGTALNGADHDVTVGITTNGTAFSNCYASTSGPWRFSDTKQFAAGAGPPPPPSLTWTLYNFEPGVDYYYKILVGDGVTGMSPGYTATCGALEKVASTPPDLPAALGDLTLTYDKNAAYESKYIMFDTDDCVGDNYLVIVDVDLESIVWYLDVNAITGGNMLTGWRYEEDAGGGRHILAIVDKQSVFELDMDGTIVHSYDFEADPDPMNDDCNGNADAAGPCPHHDVFKSYVTNNTYVVSAVDSGHDEVATDWETYCTSSTYSFVEDGIQKIDAAFTTVTPKYLITDFAYDPESDPGPYAPSACTTATMWRNSFDRTISWIDWTHANSIAATTAAGGEVVDLSLRQFDEIIRFPASLASVSWTLSAWPGRGDIDLTKDGGFGMTVSSMFAMQHDVHTDGAANTLLMFDNSGDTDGARVLRLSLSGSPFSDALIDEVWMLADGAANPLTTCTREGSARRIGSTASVLAMCSPEYTIEELTTSDGAQHVPPLLIFVPDTSTFCAAGFTDRRDLDGWYRAIPLTQGGDFQ